jgi:hypothetical protein
MAVVTGSKQALSPSCEVAIAEPDPQPGQASSAQ